MLGVEGVWTAMVLGQGGQVHTSQRGELDKVQRQMGAPSATSLSAFLRNELGCSLAYIQDPNRTLL